MNNLIKTLTTSVLLMLSNPAMAHPGAGGNGLYAGFMHPFSGMDHLVGILLIGILAYQLGKQARWSIPLVFISIMGAGFILGQAGFYSAAVETAILASLALSAIMILYARKLHLAITLPIIATFALQHGLAHGYEMGAALNAAHYVFGFTAGSGILLLTGLLLPALWRQSLQFKTAQ